MGSIVRSLAAWHLGRRTTTPRTGRGAELRELLNDNDPSVRAEALVALENSRAGAPPAELKLGPRVIRFFERCIMLHLFWLLLTSSPCSRLPKDRDQHLRVMKRHTKCRSTYRERLSVAKGTVV
jgi:hypothetical protein